MFLFFAGCCTVGTLFIYFLLPECKGLHVEEVYEVFQKHWVSAYLPAQTKDAMPEWELSEQQVGTQQQ